METESSDESQQARLDIDRYYGNSLEAFTDALGRAIVTSGQAAGRRVEGRRFWASVLFTRLCTTGVSILWLCPGSPINPDGQHWDFSAVASLVRNLFECELVLFYLGIEQVGEEERLARLRVMQLHDCKERLRMFRDFNPDDPQLKGFEAQAAELQAHLLKNSFFMSFPQQRRKKLLKGENACMLTQDEILKRMGEFRQGTRGYYRLLSSHTHSFPLAFYRMAEGNRGRGVENATDKGHIAAAIEFAATVLTRGTSDTQGAFKDVVRFEPSKYDWRLLRRKSSS